MAGSDFPQEIFKLLRTIGEQPDEVLIQKQFVEGLNLIGAPVEYRIGSFVTDESSISFPIQFQDKHFGFLVSSQNFKEQSDEYCTQVKEAVLMLAVYLERAIAKQATQTATRQNDIDRSFANLQMREHRSRILVEQSTDGIILTNEEGIVLEWNKGQERITGWSAEESIGKPLWEVRWRYMPQALRTPEALERLEAAIRRAFSRGQSSVFRQPYEAEIECKDGTHKFEEVHSYPIPTSKGYMIGILTRDVTQRKLINDELVRREYVLNAVRYSGAILLGSSSWKEYADSILARVGEALKVSRFYIFEKHDAVDHVYLSQRYEWCSPGVITQIDNPLLQNCEASQGGLANFSKQLKAGNIVAGKFTDFSEEEQEFLRGQDIQYLALAPIFAGETWWGFIGFDDTKNDREIDSIEYEAILAVATNLGNAIHREETRNALRESEQREHNRANELEALLDSAPAMVWIAHDSECKIMTGNKASYEILKMEYGENPSQTRVEKEKVAHFKLLRNDKEIPTAELPMQVAASTGEAFYNLEETVQMIDGTRIELIGNVVPLFDDEGNPNGAIGTFMDITHIKETEANLKKQMQNMSILSAIDSIVTSSFDQSVTLNAILHELIANSPVETACIFVLDEVKNVLKYEAGSGFRKHIPYHMKVALGEGVAGRVAESGNPVQVMIEDERSSQFVSSIVSDEEFRSIYSFPLITKNKVNGVLEIFQREQSPYNEEQLEFFTTVAKRAAIAVENWQLFENLDKSNLELLQAYDATIEGWSRAMDLRDEETEGHTERVTHMTVRLATLANISENEIMYIRWGALLHDIGKLGVPDAILLKPGALTNEEWQIMRQHPVYAHQMLAPIDYLQKAMDIPYCHHEHWDGSGYPNGLAGEKIPLAARLFAVVDTWDALTSDRPYRDAWTKEQTRHYIQTNAGVLFDPNAVSMFMQLNDLFDPN